MSRPGFDSPESAALEGFPADKCRVIAACVQGDLAYVLLDTGSKGQPYLYGVSCERRDGYWFGQSSANVSGWAQVDHDPDVGTLSFWDDAPVGAEAVRIEFAGELLEQPVTDNAFLVVWWRVPQPQEWPRVVGYRIGNDWFRPEGPKPRVP